MRIGLSHTLQGRFTLYLSLLIMVMMSSLAWWNISREKKLMENAIIREGKALVDAFAISCTNTMLYEDVGLVEEGGLLDNYLSDLMGRKDLNILYAMILGLKGEVIAHSQMTEVGIVYDDSVTQKALATWATLIQYPSSAILDISAPLAISTKRWGTLRVGISTENLKREISNLVLRYVAYAIGIIALTILLIVYLFSKITKPLKWLSREMDGISIRNQAPSSVEMRQDEIGILQRSFLQMLERMKETEKERAQTQRNLLLTEKMVAIGKLTSGVAHEINNPLSGILNCLYHFKKGDLAAEKQREYLDLMEDGIERIQKTVTNLLEYARTPKLERSVHDLEQLAERAFALLEYQMKKNQIKIVKDIPPSLPKIEVDSNQITQVLMNILLNAIQAMPQGGTLTLGLRSADGRMTLTISDTGSGISQNILPKVFDPFFTTKGEGKGTGLGLWISQNIVERHGGTITIASQEGKGTTLEIQFPLSEIA